MGDHRRPGVADPTRNWPPQLEDVPVTIGAVAVCLGVFGVQGLLGGAGGPFEGLTRVIDSPIALVILAPALHGSVGHLGWNLLTFAMLSPPAERRTPTPLYALSLVATGWVTTAAPLFLPGGVAYAVGLSGVTNALALFVLPFAMDTALRGKDRRRRLAAGVLGLFAVSIAIRTLVAAAGLVSTPGAAVQSHLIGLAIGSVASLVLAPQFRDDRR